MSIDVWQGRNELLKEFRLAIERRAQGRLSHLSLDIVDGALVIEASSATYYAVQLALAAVQEFTVDFPRLTPAQMSFRVNGRPLVLGNSNLQGTSGPLITNYESLDDSDAFLELDHEEFSSSPQLTPVVTSVAAD